MGNLKSLSTILMFAVFASQQVLSQGTTSMIYDYTDHSYIVADHGEGVVYRADSNLNIIDTITESVTQPRGMVIYGDTLFICGFFALKGYSLSSKNEVFSIPIGMIAWDITLGADSMLYVSGYTVPSGSRGTVFKVNPQSGSFHVFASGMERIAGIEYEKTRLIVVTNRNYSMGGNTPIYEILLSDSSVNILWNENNEGFGGITKGSCGSYYISSKPNGTNSAYVDKYTFESSTYTSSPFFFIAGFPESYVIDDLLLNELTQTIVIPIQSTNDSVVLQKEDLPKLQIDPVDTVRCEEDTVRFNYIADNFSSILWEITQLESGNIEFIGLTPSDTQYARILNEAGTYLFKLSATLANCKDSVNVLIEAHEKPNAAFGYVLESETKVNFIDSSSNVTEYFWTFGNGDTSNEASPEYIYTTPGVYNVCLKGINDKCLFVDSACQEINTLDGSASNAVNYLESEKITVSQIGQSIRIETSNLVGTMSIDLIDITGREIASWSGVDMGETFFDFLLPNKNSSLLFVRVIANGTPYVKPIFR